MESKRIAIGKLTPNKGQIEGLPANPRQWTQTDIDRIARSLRETPELFEMRPCIVYPHGEKFVILGGNLRYTGAKANKDKDVPCIVMPEDTPVEKLREIVVKDNSSFGAWDYDALANEWDDLPLQDWGVPSWKEEKLPEENASTAATELGENGEDNKMNLSFSPEDYARVLEALLAFGGSSLEECLMLALGLNE
jgi:hypothetical protein